MMLAWLLLLTGLIISAVAIYYSVVGLAAIFSAAVIPIIVMGSALEVAKLVCASWLKANWSRAPGLMKVYMTTAVVVLMLVTSMGIFGFLSKAHSDQSLVSGDVMSKIAVYDEKIKTSKDNIDANRKALKQMDEAVDQVMARSSSETGADKAVGIRRSQQKERARLQSDIQTEQKIIATLSEERSPIAAEVRKVEAEVGPLKYIAAFVYGETDQTVLEKAVTWVIITIIVVFDPLAVIMLLAAQMTFGWKKTDEEEYLLHNTVPHTEIVDNIVVEPIVTDQASNDSQVAVEELVDTTCPFPSYEEITPQSTPIQFADAGEHPKDTYEHEHTDIEEVPSETPLTALGGDTTASEPLTDEDHLDNWNNMIAETEKEILAQEARKYQILPELHQEVEEVNSRVKPELTEVVDLNNSKKKTYMTKDSIGKIQVKNRS